jgi:hypothetical protein
MLNRDFKFKLFLSNLYIYKNYYTRIKKLIFFLQKKKRLICRLKLRLKIINLPGIKKVLLFKAAALQLEKIFYIANGLKSNVNIKNVFTLFNVKNKLQVPKNSII